MVADGRLDGSKSGRKEIAAAIARQSSLITAQHYVNNPPAHGARSGLRDKMMSLEHEKGPSWIRRNGTDVNQIIQKMINKIIKSLNGCASIHPLFVPTHSANIITTYCKK
jgi:hypothetical protein